MKFHHLLFIISMINLCYTKLYSQPNEAVRGLVFNEAAERPLAEASICILTAADSILLSFAYSDSNGKFRFGTLPEGSYLLLVSYADYTDFTEYFNISAQNASHDFDTIRINRKEIVLGEVIINARRRAMEMKGDTIEYDAGSFEIRPNDKVEDLLKRLPGIQVDRDGKITAQGQGVSKVLLDGEEFFADDPTLVTKNIRADMVDKVQVFDEKSERATFTGIEDGIRSRTINVKLKEDKKNGLFGKVSTGAGSDGYYQGQGMLNRFKQETKFSVYGTVANDGKTGLSYNDLNRIGSSAIRLASRGLISLPSGDDQLETYEGSFNGSGFPRTKNGGAHYDSKWNDGRQSINANYQLGSIMVDGSSTDLIQQTLAEGLLENTTKEQFNKHSLKQKLNTIYKHAFTESSDLKIDFIAGTERFDVNNDYHRITSAGSGNAVNDQKRSVKNRGDRRAIDMTSFYATKFRKERRTLNWSLTGNISDANTRGFLRSETAFYDADSTELVDQLKTSDVKNANVDSRIEYTEPLSKDATLLVSYGLAMDNSIADRKSFNYIDGLGYVELDTTFSNHYRFRQFGNSGGVRINYNFRKKIQVNFGTDITGVTFRQDDLNMPTTYKRNFINWSPEMFLRYQLNSTQYIRAVYRGTNLQPTIEEVQPILNNADPLNISLGNPDLEASFSNKIEIDYSNRDTKSGKYIYVDFDYAVTRNAIIRDVSTEIATGRTLFRYANLPEKSPIDYKVEITFSRPIVGQEIKFYLGAATRKTIAYSYINSALNTATSGSYWGSASIYWRRDDKFNLSIAFQPDYSINRLSLQPEYNNNAQGYSVTGSLQLFLPAKIKVDSDVDYNYRGKTALFADFRRTIWNASISRTLLKGDNLRLSLSGYDLLNQNQRFDRSVVGNTFRQHLAAVIQRYFMFSLSWDFTSFKTLPPSTL